VHLVARAAVSSGGPGEDGRQRPGTKTDEREAPGLAALRAPGVSQPSLVPPPAMRAFRDLTRPRGSLGQTRPQAQHRGYTTWEETNSQLARVVAEGCGKRARRMVAAWVAGARDAAQRSGRALGRVRRTSPPLAGARAGPCTAHHAPRMAGARELGDGLGRPLGERAPQRHAWLGPMAPQLEPLDSLPGVHASTAPAMLAEMGLAMPPCGSASRLAAWGGVAPGHHDRAGTRRQGRTRRGTRSRRRVVVQWAGAPRQPAPFVGRTLRRLAARLGGPQAAVAVAPNIWGILSPLRLAGTFEEEERSERLWPRQADRERQRARKALERLGSAVTLAQGASSAGVASPIPIRGGLVATHAVRRPPDTGAVCPHRGWDFVGKLNGLFHRPLLPTLASSPPAGPRQDGSGDGCLRRVRGGCFKRCGGGRLRPILEFQVYGTKGPSV
jgi:hypothetical protein